ncbi:serine hydrolase [Gramella sp. GC03-9]|uniref:Serine hydrolase n=1 Tax=Christiangramia oceanisediminis TaxID=2920386 RepID=A0A9X2KVP4_9FLAO|nr:serine hydrolase [Gramella oceanisediminis]MCP9198930.1 serine hydrolase [Gramella oceanisediminis]
MKRILVTVFLFTGLLVHAQSENKEAIQLIEAWLSAQQDYENLPAITAAIVKDQEIIWKGAYGMANIEEGVEAKPETICSICSISKLFTSVAVMKLVEEGKLRLDDKIEDILPNYDLQQQFEDSWPITIRSLLTHSSGLPREANFPYWTAPDFPFPQQQEIDENLKSQETLYPSSKYFQYSNLGLTLLGEVVAEVSGMSYDEYVMENIINPLKLNDTRTELPEELYGKQLAIGYTPEGRSGERDRVNFFQARGIKPAAGYSSTVEDLAKFAMWQFRLLDTTKTEILKSSTLEYMQNVHWTDPDFDHTWGLGFSVSKGPDGSKWVGHGGSCPGYRTSILLNPKTKMAYVVMINAGGENPGKYIRGMHALLSKKPKKDSTATTKVNLEDYTGYYDLRPWSHEMYIGTWGDKLVSINLPTDNASTGMSIFKHVEGDRFRRLRDDEELGEYVEFERDDNGKVVRLKRHNNYVKKIQP